MRRLAKWASVLALDVLVFGALLVLLAGPARAQFLGPLGGLDSMPPGGAAFAISFSAPGNFASGFLSDTGQAITVTRASASTCCVGGARQSVPAGSLCVESNSSGTVLGALLEPAGSNFYLNSDTPATQPITLGTGTYTLWMEGSGSEQAAVGTAVATGLPCTASGGVVCGTHGTVCTFTVTSGGTVTITKSGSPTNTSVELGGIVTSYQPSGGTIVNRAAVTAKSTTSLTLGAQSFCMQANVIVHGLNSGGFNLIAEPYVDANNVWSFSFESTPKLRLNGFVAGASHVALSSNTLSLNVLTHVVTRYDGVNETVCLGGTCASTAFSFSAPTAFGGVLLGDDFGAPGAFVLNGNLAGLKVFGLPGSCS